MSTTDWIQFWLAIGTGILAIISTISIIVVLIQNKQIIETSKRPFILIYKDLICNTNTAIEYLVIKNSGSSTAHITSIDFDEQEVGSLNKDYSMLSKALIRLNNSYIAPNQNYKIPFKSKDSGVEFLKLEVTYSNGVKTYHDSFQINLQQDYSIASIKQHSSSTNPEVNNELKDISETLQELVKRIS